MGMYTKIWLLIQAADPGVEIPVKCPADNVRRLVQAVRKEKTKRVALRKKLGMLRPGQLKHRVEEVPDSNQAIIYFHLPFDGTKI